MSLSRFPDKPEVLLKSLFDTAVEAAQPERCIAKHLPHRPQGRTIVVGFGKGAAAMASALEAEWDGPLEGVVVTRYGHEVPCKHIRVLQAAHPVPDQAGIEATKEILEATKGLSEDDLVICLISGGGSALFVQPPEGVTLEEKQDLTKQLLASGAPIGKINIVRRHLSLAKGGRLAEACAPASVVSLIISDVPGDDLEAIASGPTVPDPSTRDDALAILGRYRIPPSPAIEAYLESPKSETPGPDAACFEKVLNRLIATPMMSLDSAASLADAKGVSTSILGDSIEGETRDVAREQAGMVMEIIEGRTDTQLPCVLLSGGETTVTLTGNGRGGPNTEYALSLAIALDGLPGVYAIACDTDGVDGSEDNAGALVMPDTLERAKALGLDPEAYLNNNDSYSFFERLGDLVITGPTHTNVNDFRAILITKT